VDFARSREKTFKNFFGRVKTALRADWLGEEVGWRNPEEDRALFKSIDACQHKVLLYANHIVHRPPLSLLLRIDRPTVSFH
jgi:hypothetical protein